MKRSNNLFKIKNTFFEDDGEKIFYSYEYDKELSKFFNSKNPFFASYGLDVSQTPKSIAVIPLLANLLPISWFVGFSIEVEELDLKFVEAMEQVKFEFQKMYPNYDLTSSSLICENIVKNDYRNVHTGMLFTGGVDAYTTYFRHCKKNPDLIKIIERLEFTEESQEALKEAEINNNEILLQKNRKYYIESNLRNFYTDKVSRFLGDVGWWSHVQHGLGLTGLVSPLSYIRKHKTVYIASSFTNTAKIVWGSTPEADNHIAWASTRVNHDGYEIGRQEKIDHIIQSSKQHEKIFKLRVCFSPFNTSLNCSNCEKCHRTILAIILNNDNPNNFGFKVSASIYDDIIKEIKSGFKSEGMFFFWKEIHEKMLLTKEFFIFNNKNEEFKKFQKLKGLLDQNLKNGIIQPTLKEKIALRVTKVFPKSFRRYRRFRENYLKHKNATLGEKS